VFIVSSWYLSEIIDPLANRAVTFTYENQFCSGSYTGYSVDFMGQTWLRKEQGLSGGADDHRPLGYINVNYQQFIGFVPFLTRIDCPDNYFVKFGFDAYKTRDDFKDTHALDNIDVGIHMVNDFSQYSTIKYFKLNTAYMFENSIVNYYNGNNYDFKTARLCLISLQEFGPNKVTSQPKYTFNYNLGSNATEDFVPPLFCANKDNGGYYNGSNATILGLNLPLNPQKIIKELEFKELANCCFVNTTGPNCISNHPLIACGAYSPTTSGMVINPKNNYAKNGLLQQIHLPTGGYIEYEYEQNMAKVNNIGSDIAVEGVHVSKTKTFASVDATLPETILKYIYLKKDGTSSLFGIEQPINQTNFNSRYDAVDKNLHLGFCDWTYSKPGTEEVENTNVTSSSSDFEKAMVIIINIAIRLILGPIADIILFATGMAESCAGQIIDERHFTIYSNVDLNRSNALPKMFSSVTVEQIGNTTLASNGKVNYTFTSPNQYPFWSNFNSNINQTQKQRYGNWLYGLPLTTTVYDINNKIVKTSENIFSNHQATITNINSCNCKPSGSGSDMFNLYSNNIWGNYGDATNQSVYNTTSVPDIALSSYGYSSGRLELDETLEMNYKPDFVGSETDPSNFSSNFVKYQYNPFNYQPNKVYTSQSNGDLHVKEIYYPIDYTTPGILQDLITNNIINTPIASYSAIIKRGSSIQEYLGASVTEYGKVNADLKPIANYIANTLVPIPYTFSAANPKNFLNLVKTQEIKYDTKGNISTLKDQGNRQITNIYGYNDKYLIASVINADAILDKPAYTSFEKYDFGLWVLNGAGMITNKQKSVTGKNAFQLYPSMNFVAQINTNKSYILSVWAKTNDVTINGVAPILNASVPAIEGFGYYQTTIPAGTASVVVSTNNATGVFIDELRLFPENSRMRTVSYDEIFGKISECDENNRTTYYEYDDLGRLRCIKDNKKDIIKVYDYNYKN
jgi:YD repeat-containing protein